MKNITTIFIICIIWFTCDKNQAQYNTPEIQGIPLIAYDSNAPEWTELDYKTMKDSAGVDILIPTNLSSVNLQRLITGPELYAIPNQYESQQNPEIKTWIYYYSEGRYTNWEAEGTNPEDGDASIYYKESIGTIFQEGSIKGVVTNDYAEYDTLIYGPLYRQEVNYLVTNPGLITYQADYKLKLTNTIPRQGDPQPSPTDEICRLQVTVSDIYIDDEIGWVKETTPVQDILLLREDFNTGNWETKSITYNLNNLENKYCGSIINSNGENKFAHYVEFKIIWLGDPNSKMYVDNIIVSDERGRAVQLPSIQERIIEQDNATYIDENYENFIKAWIGRDEPESIDMFEPIRIISNVLNDNNQGDRPLVMNLSSTWNGRFGDEIPWKNSNYVVKSEEFVKRTNNTHIWQNTYMFDYPFKPNRKPWWVDDFRDWNIRIYADSILSRINKADSLFGQLIMCGKFWNEGSGNVEFREIEPYELSYAINLSLLYGAKSLVLFSYFGRDENHTGLVNYDSGQKNKTDKFYHMKNVISPRLKGSFGKTLRNIWQTEQFLNINASENYNYITHFSGNLECLPSTAKYDLGFFTDSWSRDYFMIISRWYNEEGVCPIYANLDENYFSHNNLLLTKYASDTSYTIPNDASIKLNLVRGDAEFCRIVPVVYYGGDLVFDETISGTNTLTESDLKIKDGARLTVSGTYNIERDIIVEQGGELVLNAGAQLVFYGTARLTVNGNLVSNGTPTNKVAFTWGPMLGSGITIKKNITLQHIRITGADVAINIDLSNQGRTGTTVIRYNEFVNCVTDIAASNTNSVLIQNNNLSLCDMGIFLSNVSSFNIVGNYLESETGEMPGIFVNSSSGNIRANTITVFSNGIVCANSSPSVGGNIIFKNSFHGIYVGEGSQPDLSAALYQVPCSTPPLYYPVSGFNHIYENGGLTTYPLDDGSEIYLSNSNILLDEGSNCIIDNREERAPVYSSRLLINGNIDIPVLASYNEWGWHPEFTLDQRFDIDVTYAPTGSCALPDNLIDCELIIKTIDGIVIDTIYAVAEANEEEEEIEEMYAQAESKYLSQDYTGAKTLYNEIITDYAELRNSFTAFSRLLTIERIESENPSAYEQLRDFYLSNLNVISDTLLNKMVMQLANLTLISGGVINEAIDEFQDIIDNNPGSEAADFAEIDIYTTALLNQDSVLAKGKLVKVTGDNYISMVNSLIKKRFSSNIETGDQIIIPVEYLLYQNYPNPFNPMTTIKFDLPKDGIVTLEIFDILGRKVRTLVNEYKSADSYNHSFNASKYASGVYIYKLKAGDYVSSKKMILLK